MLQLSGSFEIIGDMDRNRASRRTVLRGLAAAGATLAVSGCAGVSAIGSGARFDASQLSEDPRLLVATTRKPVNGARERPWYGAGRASTTTVARAKLTPPAEGRFSLASVGLGDWQVDTVEPAR